MEKLDINANEVSHTEPDYDAAEDDAIAEDLEEASGGGDTGSIADDDLDDWGEGLCRWPNVDFSVVKADTKTEALVELDEWAGAEAQFRRYLGDGRSGFASRRTRVLGAQARGSKVH